MTLADRWRHARVPLWLRYALAPLTALPILVACWWEARA